VPTLYSTLRSRHRPTLRRSREATMAAARPSERAFLANAAVRQKGKPIVVIGAGLSGLVAGYELQQVGYAVTIVEARDRVGGRVWTLDDVVPGKQVEGGGELIGSNHPMWLAYQKAFGLEFLDVTDEPNSPMILHGRQLGEAHQRELLHHMDEALGELTHLAATIVDPYQPWINPDAAALDRQSLEDWIAKAETSPLCKDAIRLQMAADNGVACSAQSLLGNLAMIKGGGLESYWTETEVYRCHGGNTRLAKCLEQAFVDLGGTMRDRANVGAVVHGDAGVRVSVKGDPKPMDAADVVLTVPPAAWSNITFTPPLAPPGPISPGTNVKFLMHVKRRFWRDHGVGATMTADGPVDITWEGTERQGGVEADLTAFSGGRDAETCRAWPAAEREARYLAALDRGYHGIKHEMLGSRFMDWPGDQFARASYSFPAPGEVTTVGPWLHRGLGRLHFAGEHTCYAFVGYMEGALNSGLRVARQIVARDR
jgi:monoamine oxidase